MHISEILGAPLFSLGLNRKFQLRQNWVIKYGLLQQGWIEKVFGHKYAMDAKRLGDDSLLAWE